MTIINEKVRKSFSSKHHNEFEYIFRRFMRLLERSVRLT